MGRTQILNFVSAKWAEWPPLPPWALIPTSAMRRLTLALSAGCGEGFQAGWDEGLAPQGHFLGALVVLGDSSGIEQLLLLRAWVGALQPAPSWVSS